MFLERLNVAPPVATREGAFALIADTLNGVEDEFTSIPFDPSSWQSDGRMYPPQRDARRSVPGRDDLVRYRSVGHNTYLSDSGAIRIETLSGLCLFEKAGREGRRIIL